MSRARISCRTVVTAVALAVALLMASACTSAVRSGGTSPGGGQAGKGAGGSGRGGPGSGGASGTGGTGGGTAPMASQATSSTKWTVEIEGSVARQVTKPHPAGPLTGTETVDLNGSVTGASQGRAPSGMVGAMEGKLRFSGYQIVKVLGKFNADWNGKDGMGGVRVRLEGPPPLVPDGPWRYTGVIKLNCKGKGVAEWKGKNARLPETWDASIPFKMTVNGDTATFEVAGESTEARLSGRVTRVAQ